MTSFEPLLLELRLLRGMVADVDERLARMEAQQACIAAEVAVLRLRVDGKMRRDAVLRDLAGRLGLGSKTVACADAVALILAGIRRPPPGAEAAVTALAGTRLSGRQVHRILLAGAAAESADKSRAFCHSWAPRDYGGKATDEDCDDAR